MPEGRFGVMPAHPILRTTYLADARTLQIVFVTGKMHSFAPVPPEIAEAMRRSPSKVEFFAHRIRERFPVAITEAGTPGSRLHGEAHLV